jgi:hypothetical protein
MLWCAPLLGLSVWINEQQAHSSQEATRRETKEAGVGRRKEEKAARKNSPKSVFEQRQEVAVKISKEHSPLPSDPSKKHLFVAKHIDTHLMIDTLFEFLRASNSMTDAGIF